MCSLFTVYVLCNAFINNNKNLIIIYETIINVIKQSINS